MYTLVRLYIHTLLSGNYTYLKIFTLYVRETIFSVFLIYNEKNFDVWITRVTIKGTGTRIHSLYTQCIEYDTFDTGEVILQVPNCAACFKIRVTILV